MAQGCFQLWSKHSGDFYGELLERPELSDHEMAHEVNNWYDKSQRVLREILSMHEPLVVEYLPPKAELKIDTGMETF